jgi:hypothetical protein
MGEEPQRYGGHSDGEAANPLAETLAVVRAERDRRRATGEDTAWLNEVLDKLPPATVVQLDDLDVVLRLHDVVERHGTGPWAPQDLAAIAGVDPAAVRRVLEQMAHAGQRDSPETGQ